MIKPCSRSTFLRLSVLAAFTATVLLAGCGLQLPSATSAGTAGTSAPVIRGLVHGGQQPVNGSTIQLYSVGTTGLGSTATPLIGATVTSASDGTFSITGKYSCATATQVYIVASGGDAGAGNNSALTMMTALGPCSSLTSSSFISINELTTVAAAYALAPFTGNSFTKIGASGSNPTGLVNAFNTAQMLVSSATGTLASNTNFTTPTTELNTLADILAACVNTSGATSSACSTLFSATGASDTIGAATAIAKAPGASAITALWTLPASTPPFNPTLSAAPNDFTVAVAYTGSGISKPMRVAIDAAGNAWITDLGTGLALVQPFGSAAFNPQSYKPSAGSALSYLSIDRSGNIWATDPLASAVFEYSSSGSLLSGASGYTANIAGPQGIANDSAGNAWVANLAGSLTKLTPLGANSTSYTNATLTGTTGVAIDSAGNVIVASGGTGDACIFANNGTSTACYNDTNLFFPLGVAVSSSGNIVMSGYTGGSTIDGAFSLMTTAGVINPASPINGNGLPASGSVAFDGAGVAWFAGGTAVAAFNGSTPISPANGYGSFTQAVGLAIDASGNVWITDRFASSVSILVGAATPVTTPLAANVGP